MANEQNLENGKATQFRSGEEAARNGQIGGRASGAARRRKKSLREAADLYLSLPLRDKRKLNAMLRDGIDPEDADNQMAIIVGLAKMAMAGDSKSAKVLFELLNDGGAEDRDEIEDDGLLHALDKLAGDLFGDGDDSAMLPREKDE